jgi:hypothetical protein
MINNKVIFMLMKFTEFKEEKNSSDHIRSFMLIEEKYRIQRSKMNYQKYTY